MTTGMREKACSARGSPCRRPRLCAASRRKRENAPGLRNFPGLESAASSANCGATSTAFARLSEICARSCWRRALSDVAFDLGSVAVKENDDDAGPLEAEASGNMQQHALVVIGFVLPVDMPAPGTAGTPALIVDVKYPAAGAGSRVVVGERTRQEFQDIGLGLCRRRIFRDRRTRPRNWNDICFALRRLGGRRSESAPLRCGLLGRQANECAKYGCDE